MVAVKPLETEGMEKEFSKMYREFFDQAEKRRRWNIREDIPWDKVNRHLDPAIALVVESYCAVEMFLPDYMGKGLPMYRPYHGRTWFHINWGYEESKHSLALSDWLLASGMRTEEQMEDLERRTIAAEYELPYPHIMGVIVYAMAQELATWLNYRNVRRAIQAHGDGDPALETALNFIMVDERCHFDFYMRVTKMYLQRDRSSTLEILRDVLKNFRMPAHDLLADSEARERTVRSMKLFDEDIFFSDVLKPILEKLDVSWTEYRERKPGRKSLSKTGILVS
jgi:acyl-[acyl-carrier-protein] desaturase